MYKPKRILVVDDEPGNTFIMGKMLESLGYEHQVAHNGAAALENLGPGIDLVLLDVIMPGMNGFEVCRRIRDNRDFGDIPVIMVTVLAGKEDRLAAVEAGANDFVGKPVDKLELSVRVASLLKVKEAQDILKRHAAELEIAVQERSAELRASEELFRNVFEAAQDCIFIKDKELRYTHVNPASMKALGLTLSDIIGKTSEEIFGPEYANHRKDQEIRVLQGHAIESEHTFGSGPELWTYSFTRFPIRNAQGEITGLCAIARDVSERKPRDPDRDFSSGEYVSDSMRHALAQARLAGQTESTVLLLGENGSGKDHVARFLHDNSRRGGGPFLNINCAALAPELAESELFGHEAGAFTGARGRRRGFFELAEGGTLLLNEVGDLLPLIQAKLLTFLDTQSFIRVGGEKPVSVNVRLLAATNRDLEAEVSAGRFRKDLYYRLNVFSIKVPPLRDRIEDLPVLIQDILLMLGKKTGLHTPPTVNHDAMQALAAYHWPGNVRELRNILERALILCGGGDITTEHLSLDPKQASPLDLDKGPALRLPTPGAGSMPEILDEEKRFLVTDALKRSGGSIKEAAALLGVSRGSLKHHMKTLGLHGWKTATNG